MAASGPAWAHSSAVHRRLRRHHVFEAAHLGGGADDHLLHQHSGSDPHRRRPTNCELVLWNFGEVGGGPRRAGSPLGWLPVHQAIFNALV
eukprot:2853315-Prorocentrum_lima.AAC.1